MGASLNEIKQRIASTKKTSQITKAIQMVSAAKLTKSETAASNFQLYASKIRSIVTHLVSSQLADIQENISEDNPLSDLLTIRPVQKTCYLVITSDKGLVGGYNSSILKQTMKMIERDHQSQDEFLLISIGGMGSDFFKKRGYTIAYELRGVSDQPSFDEVRKIVSTITTMYKTKLFDELYVCYNHHENALTSQFRMERMLPIIDLSTKEEQSYEEEYILEPSQTVILEKLLPQYAESLIFGAIIDAKTAEHAAGMTAMKTATDNAQNIINELTISYNRARQDSITQEITEIVAGAVALE